MDFRELFERYGAAVYRRARFLLGNDADAEEAVQEVFIRAMRGTARFEGRSSELTWLVRITTYYCINVIRDRSRRRELWDTWVKGEPLVGVPGPSPESMATLREALARADEQTAAAAVCVHVEGMSHEEAAEVLGVSRRTVGNILERFTKRLVDGEK